MADAGKRWVRGELTLELTRAAQEVRLRWLGKSTDRRPGEFLVPVLAEAFLGARAAGVPLVLDFSALDHMSAFTFTHVVSTLDDSRRLAVPVVLEYSATRRWQALSFSALRTFETLDGRVRVDGK